MPGLGTLADAPMVARIIHATTGEDPDDLRIAGQGQTSVVWYVEARGGPYCVLVEIPAEARHEGYREEPTSYGARHAILEGLSAAEARSPRPIATASTIDGRDPTDGRWDWMVTEWAAGETLTDTIPDAAATDLGRFLAALHGLPVDGYGRLEDRADVLHGAEDEHEAGLLSRWGPELWPFDGRALLSHPVVRAVHVLVATIATLRDGLMRYSDGRTQYAVCHTDLNGSHLLVEDGRLSAVIDFGDAAIVPPAFDIASFAFYFGWESAEALLQGYTTNSVFRDIRRAEAQQLAVVLALQKIEKHTVRIPDEERVARTISFLEQTLPLALRREA